MGENLSFRFIVHHTWQVRQNFLCCIFTVTAQIAEDDQFIFCGTTSGDIMKINLRTGLLSDCGPVKAKYSLVSHNSGILYISNESSKSNFSHCSCVQWLVHRLVFCVISSPSVLDYSVLPYCSRNQFHFEGMCILSIIFSSNY